MNNILLGIMIIAWLYIIVMWINSICPIVKHKVVETHYKSQLFDDVELIHYEYYKKYPFCKWKLYDVENEEQFKHQCQRFAQICNDDWKTYMNFEVDNTIYYID
jgi:hypothetical protein